MLLKRTFILSFIFLVSGCVSGLAQQESEQHFYTVDVNSGQPAKSFPEQRVLFIPTIRVLPKFAGTALVFQTVQGQFAPQQNHQFVLPPGDMFAQQIKRWLAKSGIFSNVELDEQQIPDYVLDVAVTKLYGNVSPTYPSKAVLEMQFFLTKVDEPKNVLYSSAFRVDADIDGAVASEVVTGWREATEAILTKLEFGLNDYFYTAQGD